MAGYKLCKRELKQVGVAHCEEARVDECARDLGGLNQIAAVAVGRIHLHGSQRPRILRVLPPCAESLPLELLLRSPACTTSNQVLHWRPA